MIEKIEIQYFRSIYRTVITGVGDINVITGKNDVGKSNVLRALNLFFNNYIINQGDYKFSQNYNLKRLEEVRKDTIKGKQFIQIKVTFIRGNQYEKTLPEKFTVTKKWNREDEFPQISDNVGILLKKNGRSFNARSKASLTRFLNNIKYIYIPAIKDKYIFDEMLERLQETVYTRKLSGNALLSDTMNTLYENVGKTTQELSNEFKEATNIESTIATPNNVSELYKTLKIITKMDTDTIRLEDRGDGIQVRYIPSILNYISKNTSERYIWGFEEPENSLEFNMARKMAEDFYNVYRKNNLIFLTTHSPAFVDIGYRDFGKGFRCYKDSNMSKIVSFEMAHSLKPLSEELGYAYIMRKQYEEYKKLIEKNNEMEMVIEELEVALKISQKPILLTEGKTDAKILEVAWEKLFDYECPYDIKSCNLLKDDSRENAIAGAGILNKILCSTRYDSGKIIIGMFDNDKAGVKEFELDANYKFSNGKKWKEHKNKQGYAFVIPANDDLKKIADAQNLSIEFLFDYETLQKEVDGKKLILDKPKKVIRINGIEIGTEDAEDTYWYMSKIQDSSKTDFAYYVVPTLEKQKFENFRQIFSTISEILEIAK